MITYLLNHNKLSITYLLGIDAITFFVISGHCFYLTNIQIILTFISHLVSVSILWLDLPCDRGYTRLWWIIIIHHHQVLDTLSSINQVPQAGFNTSGVGVTKPVSWDDLTHWGRVTHICVGTLTIIGSDNGLSPSRRQAIIWTNAGLLLIGPLRKNFNEISIKILSFLFKKMHLKVSSAKCRPFCLGLIC